MSQIAIELPTETYLPGEVVKGTVNLSIDKTVKARNVKLDIFGLEKTRIIVNSGTASRIISDSNYIMKEEIILRSPDHDKKLELHPGNFTFTFEFKIPENASPSYKGSNASITYELNSRVDVPLLKDVVAKKSFRVSKNREDMALLTQPANFQSDNFSQPNSKKPGFSVELTKAGMYKKNVTPHAEKIEIPIHEIFEGMPNQFNLPIPKEAPPSYECKLSNFRWTIEVGLGIALRTDVKEQSTVEVF